MRILAPSEFGPCPCGGVYEERFIEVKMTVGGEDTQIDDVPQGRCPSCGSAAYKAAMLEEIEAVFRGQVAPGLRVLL